MQSWRSVLLVFAVCAAAPGGARADVWAYEAENGTISFSDRPRAGAERRSLKPRKPAREHRVVSFKGPSDRWDRVIAYVGVRHRVPPGLVKAVIHAESRFDPGAVSRAGAQGLMQLMPPTAASVGVDDPFDPWQNISGGTRYLSYLMRRFQGDLKLSLAAYNAGETTVRRYGGIPPYAETERYVHRVLHLYKRYDADFN